MGFDRDKPRQASIDAWLLITDFSSIVCLCVVTDTQRGRRGFEELRIHFFTVDISTMLPLAFGVIKGTAEPYIMAKYPWYPVETSREKRVKLSSRNLPKRCLSERLNGSRIHEVLIGESGVYMVDFPSPCAFVQLSAFFRIYRVVISLGMEPLSEPWLSNYA